MPLNETIGDVEEWAWVELSGEIAGEPDAASK
jgi:hypothetical protein